MFQLINPRTTLGILKLLSTSYLEFRSDDEVTSPAYLLYNNNNKNYNFTISSIMTSSNSETELLTEHFGYPPVVRWLSFTFILPYIFTRPYPLLTKIMPHTLPTESHRRYNQQREHPRRARPQQRRTGPAERPTLRPGI